MLSSACNPGLEATAEAADTLRIFQLYVRGDQTFVDDHVSRAIDNGYVAFCFTVDTAHYSRRERDIAKRYQTVGRRRVEGRRYQMELEWPAIKRIKARYKIPLIIKGIATADEAQKAALQDICSRSLAGFKALSVMLAPVLPALAERVARELFAADADFTWADAAVLPQRVAPFKHLMQRVEPQMLEDLFEPPAVLADPTRPRSTGPDGTVDLERYGWRPEP